MLSLYVYDWSRMGIIYPYVGFLHCPSLRIGQCEGLDTWDGQGLNPHVFLFIGVSDFFRSEIWEILSGKEGDRIKCTK